MRSERIHSRYRRRLADLLWRASLFGCRRSATVSLRRVLCGRRIFAERFEEDVLALWQDEPPASTISSTILACPGRPAGGELRPKADAAVSNDTSLRVARRRAAALCPADVIGIDDWRGGATSAMDYHLRPGTPQNNSFVAGSRTARRKHGSQISRRSTSSPATVAAATPLLRPKCFQRRPRSLTGGI